MKPLVYLSLRLLAVVWIIATLMPLWRHDGWWVRAFDFPRVQILVSGLVLAAIGLGLGAVHRPVDRGLWIALGLCLFYHGWRILPFTPLLPVEVAAAPRQGSGADLSLLVANVLMENHRAAELLEQIDRESPDVVLALETDSWWTLSLRVIAKDYPFRVEVPLDNTYGMALYSRLELVEPRVKFLVDREIPSIHGGVRLADGQLVRLHLVHPQPPYPAESTETTERDGELLLIGREVGALDDVPTIVAGDFNDVAWSYTTRLLRRISGLRDPRVGRGLFSSYHAEIPLLRWPLDQVLCSGHFRLVRIARLPAGGSDHFPIIVELRLPPGPAAADPEPEPEASDRELAAEKIEAADPRDDLTDVEPENE